MMCLKKMGLVIVMALSSCLTAVTPQEVLSDEQNETQFDGIVVRKGTIAATILNTEAFEELKDQEYSLEVQERLDRITEDQKILIPGLKQVHLFKLFTLDEWLQNLAQEGRIFVALLYLQQFPSEANDQIIERIKAIHTSSSKVLKPYVEETLKVISQ